MQRLHCLFYFYLGDLVSKIITSSDVLKLYPLYNWFMYKSVVLNDKYGLDIWETLTEGELDKFMGEV